MDKTTYLKNKEQKFKETEVYKRENFCFFCFKIKANCLCHLMKPFYTNVKFVILIHPMEAKKEKLGTGRIAKAILKNSELIMGIDFTNDLRVNQIISDPESIALVMYPGESAINISRDKEEVDKIKSNNKKIVVFLIDGTWPCAKKMMKLSKNIQVLPRISFDLKSESIFKIKEQPAEYCLSTIESIYYFIDEAKVFGLEKLSNEHENLIEVFKSMIDFQVKCAEDPSLPSYRNTKKGYSKKEERVKSKKWEKRKILF